MSIRWRTTIAGVLLIATTALGGCAVGISEPVPTIPPTSATPPFLPTYKHIVIVIEENKFPAEVICASCETPFLQRLVREGTSFDRMYGEEHPSEGNYLWLFSGDNQGVRFQDRSPVALSNAMNLGRALIQKNLSFVGYAEDLPDSYLQSKNGDWPESALYVRRHIPWLTFTDFNDPRTSDRYTRPFSAFVATDFDALPKVALVIPNLMNDMHDGSVSAGDCWLAANLQKYYEWARTNDSLLIVVFDENNELGEFPPEHGLTDPFSAGTGLRDRVHRNRIFAVFAGAHVKPGTVDITPLTHVNILRTIEAMYGLEPSGAQQPNAAPPVFSNGPITSAFVP